MIAMFPAVNGLFFLPITGPALSAVSFDRSGTTKIGKYILNHSFQIPGIVMVVVSVVVAMLLTQLGL
jgi:anaerobic C4-dicarboxylate transporter